MNFLVKLLVNAAALWVTTKVVSGVVVEPFRSGILASILTYLLVALIFGVVNVVVGTVLRFFSLPIYIITLGLFSLIVNGVLLLIASGVSGWFGFGLHVAGFWDGVWGALVLAVVAWLIGLIVRPWERPRAR